MSEEGLIKKVCPKCGSEDLDNLFVIRQYSGKAGRFKAFCKTCGWCPYLNKKWTAEEHKQWDRIGIGLTILGVILLFLGFAFTGYEISSLFKILGFIFTGIGIFIWKAPYTF
ncbi:hypothetical protein HZC31_01625 [Candidatus Woesearchaeota archaeon]|nr:hypothetical protein [Candidatus Woesearchaeota archaeon]